MDDRKTSWCNGCLIEYLRSVLDETIVVVDRPSEWHPNAVDVYMVGGPPVSGQKVTEIEGDPVRLLHRFNDPAHCNDGDCDRWVERHGDPGVAWHTLIKLGLSQQAYFECCKHYVLEEGR